MNVKMQSVSYSARIIKFLLLLKNQKKNLHKRAATDLSLTDFFFYTARDSI